MEKPSKSISKEIIVVVFTIVFTLAVTVLTTLTGAGFDLSRITMVELYTNILVNAVTILLVTVVAFPYGKLNTMCKTTAKGEDGKYKAAYRAYDAAYLLAKPKLYQFSQWHDQKYEKEVYAKQIRYLCEKGIKQPELILKLNREQVVQLSSPQCFEIDGVPVYFSALTKSQLKACLKVFDGKVSLHKLSDYYFLYIDGKGTSSFYEQARYETIAENAYVVGNILLKVLIGLVISCILTSLVIDNLMFDQQTILKIVTNLISRILTIGQSLYSGYCIGQEYIYKKCYYINGKTQILTEFAEDTTFVFEDPQTLAKQEYERSTVDETKN